MKLSEMRQILAEGGIQLTKSLGQNFLHDQNQLRRIVAAGKLTPADKVLEIGPGLGPLTELLLASAGEVMAIEKDARLVEILRDRFQSTDAKPGLTLLHQDALEYLRRESCDWHDWKLVSNLPYSVASPLLVELAQASRPPKRIVVTLQNEVANRLVAKPADTDYGLLTLLVQVAYEPDGLFRIPRSCFFPEPDVDSACVTLERRPQALLAPELQAAFVRLVKRSFSQRRKMMLKLLKEEWPADLLGAAFEKLQLSPQIRAEQVGLHQFVSLTQALASG